jgi:hypothetical protein
MNLHASQVWLQQWKVCTPSLSDLSLSCRSISIPLSPNPPSRLLDQYVLKCNTKNSFKYKRRRIRRDPKKKKRITKRKDPKQKKKGKTEKHKGVWSHRYIILTPKYCRKDQRSCDRGGQGTSYFTASVVQWKEKSAWRGRPKFDRFYIFWVSNKKSNAMGELVGARSAPVWGNNKFKKTGAHGRACAAKTHL